MSASAVIAAEFVDFKLVRTRSACQIVMEIPIEGADEALRKLGGVPIPGTSRPVAIAPLVAMPEPQPAKPMPVEPAATAPSVTVGGRPWRDLKFAQQAGIMCSDKDFIAWLRAADDKAAAEEVRRRCGVSSRADLDRDPDAAERWLKISHEFFGRNEAASLEQSLMNGRH